VVHQAPASKCPCGVRVATKKRRPRRHIGRLIPIAEADPDPESKESTG
jgi:hypothetical protein